jgi:hypothetical protein
MVVWQADKIAKSTGNSHLNFFINVFSPDMAGKNCQGGNNVDCYNRLIHRYFPCPWLFKRIRGLHLRNYSLFE